MMFVKSITTLAPRVKLNTSKAVIENFAFKLHYQWTVLLLTLFIILVCSKEFFGDHIKCVADPGVAPEGLINSFCFFMTTYTIVRHYDESLLQAGVLPHPGIGPQLPNDEIIHHTYYQWVPFVLFIQAVCFYLPHHIWKKMEGGRIKLLIDGLKNAILIHDEELNCKTGVVPSKQSVEKKLKTIKMNILLRLRVTRTWSTWLVGMEVLNFVHIMLQIWITDYFLGGYFISLGFKVIAFDNWDAIVNPLVIVFPTVTKCLFHKFGSGGSLQVHDALCVMVLNVVYEKIFLILWFWFLGIFIVSLLAIVWRMASFFLFRFSPRFSEIMFRRANLAKFNPDKLATVVNGCTFSDWLFLYYLAKNMPKNMFEELFNQLAEDLKNYEPSFNQYHQKNDKTLLNKIAFDNEVFFTQENQKSI